MFSFSPRRLLVLLAIYLISTTLSAVVLAYVNTPTAADTPLSAFAPPKTQSNKPTIDPAEPRTEACPLNGKLFTKTERKIWELRRPLGVMIENHLEARPLSGISQADVVYEAVAEGGITRNLAVYYCQAAAQDVVVGPVRSARTYFLDWISEYGDYPLYAHVGGANCNIQTGSGCQNGAKADALGQIRKYGWAGYNDLNEYSIGFKAFWREPEHTGNTRAWEHSAYSSTDRLWKYAEEFRGLTNVNKKGIPWDSNFRPWKFLTEEVKQQSARVKEIEFTFWDNQFADDYRVQWLYQPEDRLYRRINGGKPVIDFENKQQVTASVVIVALMRESKANDGYPGNVHLLYANKGKGVAYIFQNGQMIKGQWRKKSRTARTVFYDNRGKEVKFVPGQIWIEILPLGKKVRTS